MSSPGLHVVREPEDLHELEAILDALRGVPCWRARWSYGDELVLDLGGERPYDSPLLASATRGEWMLGTRASEWSVAGPDEDIGRVEGAHVSGAGVSYPNLDLALDFDSGVRLEITADPEEADVAAWELFTPAGMVLVAGPGRRWTLRRADEPRDALSNG